MRISAGFGTGQVTSDTILDASQKFPDPDFQNLATYSVDAYL